MTERLDKARKYVELFKKSVNNGDTEGSIMYGLRAMNILTVIKDITKDEEEVKDIESLANEMLQIHFDSINHREYKRGFFYYD